MRRLSFPSSVVALLALLAVGSTAFAQIIPWSEPPALADEKTFPTRPRATRRATKVAPTEIVPRPSLAVVADDSLVATIIRAVSLSDTVLLSTFNSTVGSGTVRANTSWVGQVTQNSGSITVGGSAGDDNGWGATGLSLDATGMTFLAITAQRDVGNLAPSVFIQLEDRALRTQVFSVSTSQFALGVPTVVHIPITAWTLSFGVNDITGWSVGGGSVGTVPFRLTFDEIAFTTSAIPEPSTYAALLGLVALGVVAYRRRAQRQ